MAKYLISVDIEGITGVVDNSFTKSNGANYQKGCKYMLHDVNAVVEGILQADEAAEIIVRDAHGSAINLSLDGLHARARLLQGWDAAQNMLTGLAADFAGVFLIGYHARGDQLEAVLAHTMSASVSALELSGKPINEAVLFAIYAATMQVPVVMISGDEMAVAETQSWLGEDLVGVAVKQSYGRASILSHPLSQAGAMLKDGAKRATAKALQWQADRQAGLGNKGVFAIPEQLAFTLKVHEVAVRRSLFAELRGTLEFDAAYQFEPASRAISFCVNSAQEALGRINLLVHLIYGFKALM